ncbi:efflux RND transporter permease subunit [Pseudomonas citronellolis]|uniref:efflux RND transporter permease subunit n=1 Tax=Pseudomonas citronellolis TaxID=53408 RepID=UPI000778A63D|nr:MMPL family transporter [Pseudomonas citronellolis]AMO76004.1 MMPL family protein [Pseudomonas citronellolis]
MAISSNDGFAVIALLADFDKHSGNRLERLLFNHRLLVIGVCLLLTLLLGVAASGLRLNASFLKTIPAHHPFTLAYLEHARDLKGAGNALRIAVALPAGKSGDIFAADYMETLRQINDDLYLVPGADRAFMRSLWTPATRWQGVTEDGFDGGPVVPDGFDGSAESLDRLRANVERSGEIGQLVARDLRSTIVYLPLLDVDPKTGQPLDYKILSDSLEQLRGKYQAKGVDIHIIGFAKVMGDLIEGLHAVLAFFAVAVLITSVVLFQFTHCWRSTLLVQGCTLVGVVWLLGLLPLLGYELNPYSILVPFLVYAIGVSHGAQKMNGIMQDVGRGTHRLIAARYTFRRLFAAGMTALLADVVGFAVLTIVDVPVIQELAVVASLGVGILVFTNLALLPIMLSFTGVSDSAAARSLRQEQLEEGSRPPLLVSLLVRFTQPKPAATAILLAVVVGVGALLIGEQLKVGDLDPGAPELRADSRYNRDNQFIIEHYQASSDVFVVMVETPPSQCVEYATLRKVEELEWRLRQLPGVDATSSIAGLARKINVGMNEGNFKWDELLPNQAMINAAAVRSPRELFNGTCDLLSIYVFLKDHRADTLASVVKATENFAQRYNDERARFVMAAGNAGIEGATNIVVKTANGRMLIGVYLAVTLLCFIAFRSWRAVLCAVLPLVLTSLLAEALMVQLNMGLKVATLPVIALGVGIGVDYALYILSVTLFWLRRGASLAMAYRQAMLFTGRVVVFTGLTLSLGVVTWVFSPIKFQADMGVLLTFMFLCNMLVALVLVPALACYLLSPSKIAAEPATCAREASA